VSRDLISKTTRNEFRELMVGYTLREIEMTFDAGGLTPRSDYDPQVGGQRRGLVECYYANIDFTSAIDIKKLLAVYEEIIENLRQSAERTPGAQIDATVNALLRRMERDGFRYESGRFIVGPNAAIVHAPSLVQLSEESIQEQVEKARLKVSHGDSAGAIANAYTLPCILTPRANRLRATSRQFWKGCCGKSAACSRWRTRPATGTHGATTRRRTTRGSR